MSTKKLNLPLPGGIHRAIFAEARDRGVPATRLVRSILQDWLDQRARAREAEELRRFAREHAGSELDLIPELESAAAAELERMARDEAR
jgi:hypothetical protein